MPATIDDLKRSLDALLVQKKPDIRDKFVEKENINKDIAEGVAKTNEILENTQKENKKTKKEIDKGKGLFGNLSNFAPLFGAIGTTFAGVFTLDRVNKLFEEIKNGIIAGIDAKRIGEEVQASFEGFTLGKTAGKITTGELPKEALKRQKDILKDLDELQKAAASEREIFGSRYLGSLLPQTKKGRFKPLVEKGLITKEQYKELSVKKLEEMVDEQLRKLAKESGRIRGGDFELGKVSKPIDIFGSEGSFKSNDENIIKQLIKDNEGLRLEAYQDTAKGMSIGYGHFVPGELLKGQKISVKEAEKFFEKDFNEAKTNAKSIPGFDGLDKNGKAALIDMTYNMGDNWWKKWPMFKKAIKIGDIKSAIQSIRSSLYFKQVGKRAKQNIGLLSQNIIPVQESVSIEKVPTPIKTKVKLKERKENIPSIIEVKKQNEHLVELKKNNKLLENLPKKIGKAIVSETPKAKTPNMTVADNTRD